MVNMDRVRVVNAGSPGGNASTNFYCLVGTSGVVSALVTFFTALKAYIPSSITMQVPASGDTLNDATGQLVGSWSATGGASVVGTGAGIQATPVGVEVAWLASAVIDQHRPVGKTLIVPVSPAAFGTGGTIGPTAVSTFTTAANALLSAATGIGIWHRPKYNYKVTPPALVRPGALVNIGSTQVRSAPVVLRSRRS
jgi:hypothetical protein